jgi:Planctomycete cytochrome C
MREINGTQNGRGFSSLATCFRRAVAQTFLPVALRDIFVSQLWWLENRRKPRPGKSALHFTFHVSFVIFAVCSSLSAAETNFVSLPPPAKVKINFERDIEPIFESSCLRCHGGEKPMSHFHLSRRAWALGGGDISTEDIVPGHADQSDLIYYVSGESEHIHMPPRGQGKPLTRRQISLLIAWIDQGAVWPSTNEPPMAGLSFAPTLRWIGVQGDKSKFRTLEGVNDGFGGGANEFSFFQQTSPTEKFSFSGHVIEPNRDINLKLALNENDLGFIQAGFDEWRQYYDNSGGYDPLVVPPELSLNQDLYVDNGRFWMNFGLTLPNWPQIVLGYEYDFNKGTESTLDWGYVNGINIAPSTQAIDQQAQIVKFDVTKDFDDWHLENNARVEFYSENNQGQEAGAWLGGAPVTQDNYHHVQGMNTLTLEKQIRDWWFLSGGFYYSKLEGDDYFTQTNSPYFNVGSGSAAWNSGRITLRRQSEIFSVASLFQPLNYLTFSVGSQNGWTRDEGFGGDIPDFEYANINSASGSYDQFQAAQDADLRFTKAPFTVLFASARGEEGSISEFAKEGAAQLINQTEATSDGYNLQAGFDTSPWTWFDWNAQYERQFSHTDYNHLQDVFVSPFGDPLLFTPSNGYPAFILSRQIEGNGFATKLTLRPTDWLSTSLTYRISVTDYSSKTDPAVEPLTGVLVSPGGPISDGRENAQTWGLSATLAPFRRVFLSGTFTYSHTRVVTAANGDPSIVPYDGDTYTLITSAVYTLNPKTTLQATYSFSYADYGQNNAGPGVPLGLDFTRHDLFVSMTRQLTKNLSGSLRYQFAEYSEPTSDNLNNFTANGIFVMLIYRWP